MGEYTAASHSGPDVVSPSQLYLCHRGPAIPLEGFLRGASNPVGGGVCI